MRQIIKWRSVIGVGVLCALACLNAPAATNILFDNGVNWSTNYYNPDVTVGLGDYDKDPLGPSTSPTWANGSFSVGTSQTVVNNALRLDTSTAGSSRSFRQTQNWNLTNNTTIEFRLRVISNDGNPFAGSVLFANGSLWNNFLIATNFAVFGGPGTATVFGDFTQWTLFRITLENMTTSPISKLYVNNQTNVFASQTTFNSAAINYLQFGDGAGAGGESGIVEWDYLRWTSTGAFPAPEPTTAVFMLGAGAMMLARFRRS